MSLPLRFLPVLLSLIVLTHLAPESEAFPAGCCPTCCVMMYCCPQSSRSDDEATTLRPTVFPPGEDCGDDQDSEPALVEASAVRTGFRALKGSKEGGKGGKRRKRLSTRRRRRRTKRPRPGKVRPSTASEPTVPKPPPPLVAVKGPENPEDKVVAPASQTVTGAMTVLDPDNGSKVLTDKGIIVKKQEG